MGASKECVTIRNSNPVWLTLWLTEAPRARGPAWCGAEAGTGEGLLRRPGCSFPERSSVCLLKKFCLLVGFTVIPSKCRLAAAGVSVGTQPPFTLRLPPCHRLCFLPLPQGPCRAPLTGQGRETPLPKLVPGRGWVLGGFCIQSFDPELTSAHKCD